MPSTLFLLTPCAVLTATLAVAQPAGPVPVAPASAAPAPVVVVDTPPLAGPGEVMVIRPPTVETPGFVFGGQPGLDVEIPPLAWVTQDDGALKPGMMKLLDKMQSLEFPRFEWNGLEKMKDAHQSFKALEKLDKVEKFEWDALDKIAKIDALKPGMFAYDIEPPEIVAKLQAQASERVSVARTIRDGRGSCGDGAIDSVQESDDVYECGRRALDRAAWDDALQSFSRVASAKLGTRAAGAIYWRAYSQNRLGQRAEALATLGELKSAYPSSGWAAEANALEVEIRQSTGQKVAPDPAGDEDLRLLALQSLANSDSDRAVPLIENVLKGAQSPRVKERALFVLAQSNKPAARDVVVRVARGGMNPDLQLKAVQFVGMFRSMDGIKVLTEIYGTSQEPAVRRAILRSYMMAGAREPLVAAARQEPTPELRLEAVRQLGNMKAGAELADLYAKESSPEVKKQILRGLAIGAQNDKLVALAQTETNPELRRTAIRSLGLNRDATTGGILTQLYAKEQAPEVREAVLDALYTQGNAAALVTLARQEKDADLKLRIVRRLSTMKAPEASEYMLELLK